MLQNPEQCQQADLCRHKGWTDHCLLEPHCLSPEPHPPTCLLEVYSWVLEAQVIARHVCRSCATYVWSKTGTITVRQNPRVSTLCLPGVIDCDQFSQAYILKAIKIVEVRMRLTYSWCMSEAVPVGIHPSLTSNWKQCQIFAALTNWCHLAACVREESFVLARSCQFAYHHFLPFLNGDVSGKLWPKLVTTQWERTYPQLLLAWNRIVVKGYHLDQAATVVFCLALVYIVGH